MLWPASLVELFERDCDTASEKSCFQCIFGDNVLCLTEKMAKNTNLDKELEAEMEGVDSDASEDEDDSGDENDFRAEESPTALLTCF